MQVVEFIFTRKTAQAPSRGTKFAAAFDLYLPDDTTFWPKQRRLIDLGLKVKIPQGHYAEIRERSGLALNYGLTVIAGIIDSDYRGSLGVIILNTGANELVAKTGDRIAQLLIHKVEEVEFKLVREFIEDETLDRTGGFASTGR